MFMELPHMATAKRKKAQELPMELPRVPRPSEQAQYMRLRLPPDIMLDVEKEAHDTRMPLTRVVINRLGRVRPSDEQTSMASMIHHMETLLTKYGTRINSLILSENLLRAVDDALAAKPAQLEAKLDELRIARRAMRELERTAE
jgi:hypothetical protein